MAKSKSKLKSGSALLSSLVGKEGRTGKSRGTNAPTEKAKAEVKAEAEAEAKAKAKAKAKNPASVQKSPSLEKKGVTMDTRRDSTSNLSLIPVAPKLYKRFYEALVLLTVFGKNRGEHTREEEFQSDHDEEWLLDPSCESLGPVSENTDLIKLRRSFTRHLAYLCDFEKGGASTTAIALQRMGTGEIIYHVASNKCSQPDQIIGFLEKVLDFLRGMLVAGKYVDGEKERGTIEEMIFELSINHAEKRISSYGKFLAENIDFVLEKWNARSGGVKTGNEMSGEKESELEGDGGSLAGDFGSEEEEQDWIKPSEIDEIDEIHPSQLKPLEQVGMI
ncbi:hypothetical protein DSL72_009232 [Monilinia vaccinii-corymbosi]|uniref:Uncharacterized protein n=1 Tax=Monilinia vaccinii-corymbosi TaxID=61207 RepID=A0A8A3PQH3_9HELO|nr:hypothetical protein DSL72_009232 [Monilinia vaccinii-corymbosi]